MKDSFRSAFYLLAPCLALGSFAIFLGRRQTAPSVLLSGPFQFSVQGVEKQEILPINVAEGYDRRFRLVLQASGKRPKWWGQSISGRSGTSQSAWKFWLERGGKRTPFVSQKSNFWTTDWDSKKQYYFNEFLIHGGEIPTDTALKVSGNVRASIPGSGSLSSIAIPFEVTLKKVGETWEPPHVSTNPHLIIRKIELRRLQNGRTVGLVTLFVPPGADFDYSSIRMPELLTGDWQLPDKSSAFFGLSFESGSNFVRQSPSNRVKTCTFQWSTATVGLDHQRDFIVTERYSVANRWPLEIAFAIKKDGKSIFGDVPPLTRPKGK
ncbi:hypothetical protein IAD21_04182 [Abditibacteriota bacterium]|nr:hypothetical protein IAD21_04182 [Abditibacteriota bacterium]